ncbi:MAG: spondin domain-containing protein [Pseudomonadota bacterium]
MPKPYLSLLLALLVLPLSAQAATVEDTARYRLDIAYAWSAETHPDGFPDNAHFTRVIGAVHHGLYNLFRDGDTASSGLALVATNGRITVLQAELDEAMRRGRVNSAFEAAASDSGTGTVTTEISVTTRHSLVSFATMLAPSPDWLTGISDVDLRQDDAWLDTVTVTLWAWDAGADSGPDFIAENADTQPRQSVRLLVHPNFVYGDGVRPIGAATFTRIQ